MWNEGFVCGLSFLAGSKYSQNFILTLLQHISMIIYRLWFATKQKKDYIWVNSKNLKALAAKDVRCHFPMCNVTVGLFYFFVTNKRETKRKGPDIKSPHSREGGL